MIEFVTGAVLGAAVWIGPVAVTLWQLKVLRERLEGLTAEYQELSDYAEQMQSRAAIAEMEQGNSDDEDWKHGG